MRCWRRRRSLSSWVFLRQRGAVVFNHVVAVTTLQGVVIDVAEVTSVVVVGVLHPQVREGVLATRCLMYIQLPQRQP